MMKNILVPIDGSEQADKALNIALDLARKYKAGVEILHVIPPVSVPFTPYPMAEVPATPPQWLNDYNKESEEESRKMLSEAAKLAQSKAKGLNVASKLIKGRPSNAIVAEAENKDSDLIVIGSRGLGGIEEFILGSVSSQVVHESKVPVLIVK